MTAQYFNRRDEQDMAKTMCERVQLSPMVGSYILASLRIQSSLPGNRVDMVLVAQLIKYASLHKGDLKRQFEREGRYTEPKVQATKAANFTFLK